MYTILAASLFDKAATPFKFDLTRLSADKSLLDLRKISDYYVRGGARFTREIPMDPAPKNAQYETLSDLGLSSIADFYPF